MCQTHKAADVVGLYMARPENAIMRAAAPRGAFLQAFDLDQCAFELSRVTVSFTRR